jgi:dihydropteroate synthase
MHMQGEPRTMQQAPTYGDLVEEVLAELEAGLQRGEAAGVFRERMLVDPGFGFGKTGGHNLMLVRRLGDLRLLGSPVLLGTSRKSSWNAVLGGGRPPEERVGASAASVAVAVAAGSVDFVRVHDVRATRDAIRVAEAIRQAREAGDLYGPGSH